MHITLKNIDLSNDYDLFFAHFYWALPNITDSHTVNKLNVIDDVSLNLETRIDLHGNGDSDHNNLCTNCCMCPILGIHVMYSTQLAEKWRVVRANAEFAFHNLVKPNLKPVSFLLPNLSSEFPLVFACRNLWSCPRKCEMATAKWLRLQISQFGTRGYYTTITFIDKNGNVVLLAVKIFDNVLFNGTHTPLHQSILISTKKL